MFYSYTQYPEKSLQACLFEVNQEDFFQCLFPRVPKTHSSSYVKKKKNLSSIKNKTKLKKGEKFLFLEKKIAAEYFYNLLLFCRNFPR